MLDISLLGTGGMIPLYNRYLTAMLARYNGNLLLIDSLIVVKAHKSLCENWDGDLLILMYC